MTVALLSLLIIPLALGMFLVMFKTHDQAKHDHNNVAYKLNFPQDLAVERVVAWIHSINATLRDPLPMLTGSPTIVFELWSTEQGLYYRLLCPWQHADYVIGQLRTLVPGIHAVKEDQHPERRLWSKAVELGLSTTGRQLNIGDPNDTSASIIGAINMLQPQETVLIQFVCTPATRTHKPVHERSKTSHSNVTSLLGGFEPTRDEINDRRDKLDEPNMLAVMRVAAAAGTPVRAEHLMDNVKRALKARSSASVQFKKRLVGREDLQKRLDKAAGPIMWPAQLKATELAALIAWPLGGPALSGLPPIASRHIPPTSAVPIAGRMLGMSNIPGSERPVAVTFQDALTHQWVCGGTGSGKTTLMANQFRDDITAGHGALLIEAKGDLFHQVLDYIPDSRRQDVIVMNFNDTGMPVGLNLLDQGNTEHVIDEITTLFDNMYAATRGVWSRAVFYNGLKALAQNPNHTLLDLGPLLAPQTPEQVAWRNSVIGKVKDEAVRHWFAQHDAKPEAKQQQIIQPVMDRIWELSKPKIRLVLGQSNSAFQFKDVVQQNKIVLMNLSGVEPETANLIGALVFNAYWYAVKTSRPPEKPNFGYLDEFQSFTDVQTDFADVLAKARSFKWGLVMGNQYRDQLSPSMQNALDRNAKTKVVFNAAGSEARAFANEFGSMVKDDDFLHLGPYQAIARVASNGSITPAFTLATNGPARGNGNKSKVIAESTARYGKPAAEVEAETQARRTAGGNGTRHRFSNDW